MVELLTVGAVYVLYFAAVKLVALVLGGIVKVTIFARANKQHASASPSVRAHRQRSRR